MVRLHVGFDYEADPDNYDTNDPEEMANIDLEQIQNGDLDVADLVDEDALETIKITPVSS